jgi:hypothetical protein
MFEEYWIDRKCDKSRAITMAISEFRLENSQVLVSYRIVIVHLVLIRMVRSKFENTVIKRHLPGNEQRHSPIVSSMEPQRFSDIIHYSTE